MQIPNSIENILANIQPTDRTAYDACIERFDFVAKPVGSLGKLETLLARVAAIEGSAEVDIAKKCVLTFCADNGVVAQGVAQCGSEVTTAIARMLAWGKASVCVMARNAGADAFPIDIGMVDTVGGLIDHKLMHGTGDITQGPAMTREMALTAMQIGMDMVREKKDQGYALIATGEAGIGNSTTSSAIASVLLRCPAIDVTGRGAGLSDDGLIRKRDAIEKAIKVNEPDPDDALDVLAKLGGLDIAAMAGMFIGGAYYQIPVVMDGLISSVAALVAVRLCDTIREYILPSHISAEPAGRLICEALGFEPVLHADMRLGEGTGAVALFPLLDLAAAVYTQAATFADIAVDEYKRDPC